MRQTIPNDELVTVYNAMMKYGGSFIRSLGRALMSADWINQRKIKNTWNEDWDKYKKMGEREEI